jgi:aldehyde:ferredoxin oxidoreductase
MAGYESLGFCQMSLTGIEFELKYAVNLINAIFDLNKDTKWLEQYGKEVILEERKFNFAAGFSEEDDKIPDFFKEEKLPPYNLVVDVPEKEYKSYWDKSFWENS